MTDFGSVGLPTRMNITNPILRGFNPDPSILRVGDDYYIATSTFEWYPGVQIHRSRDLVNWRLLTRPLRRASQLDMRGDPDSCGIWAPCLTYADGLFYLIYTDVKRYGRASIGGMSNASLRDFHNFLVTSNQLDGEWSEPIYLNSSGFDPSLFHDEAMAASICLTCSGTIAPARTGLPESCSRNIRIASKNSSVRGG